MTLNLVLPLNCQFDFPEHCGQPHSKWKLTLAQLSANAGEMEWELPKTQCWCNLVLHHLCLRLCVAPISFL